MNLRSISVLPNMNNIISLITTVQSGILTSNSLIDILYDGNQNDACQILNILAEENIQFAIQNNISAISLSVSPLYQDNSIVHVVSIKAIRENK